MVRERCGERRYLVPGFRRSGCGERRPRERGIELRGERLASRTETASNVRTWCRPSSRPISHDAVGERVSDEDDVPSSLGDKVDVEDDLKTEPSVDVGVMSDPRSEGGEVRSCWAVRADDEGDGKRGGKDADEWTVASSSRMSVLGDIKGTLRPDEAGCRASGRDEENGFAGVDGDRSERDAETLSKQVGVEGKGANVVRSQSSCSKPTRTEIVDPDRNPRDPAPHSAHSPQTAGRQRTCQAYRARGS